LGRREAALSFACNDLQRGGAFQQRPFVDQWVVARLYWRAGDDCSKTSSMNLLPSDNS
jgi:hypothetical protein